jgi:putative hydrolase of the HAD superfamily
MAIKVIAFDADDTLWVNEPFFREAEEKFAELLEDFMPQHSSIKELYRTEIENIGVYGYGIKGFTLSMIETAMRISDQKISVILVDKIIQIGRDMLDKPVELLPGVVEVLKELNGDFRIVLATKGDLLDQERKLKKSGLANHFHHIEIMSDKKISDFEKLLKHLDIEGFEFLMLGNSLKSDILPVLELGGYGIHIPFHITWKYEVISHNVSNERFFEVTKIVDAVKVIRDLGN